MLLGIHGSQRPGRAPCWAAILGGLACGFAGWLSVSPVVAQGQPQPNLAPTGVLSAAGVPGPSSVLVPARPFGADAAGDTPQTRLRPIAAPSAVDAIRAQQAFPQVAQPTPGGPTRAIPAPTSSPTANAGPFIPASFGGSAPVRQAAMMQSPNGSGLTLPSMPPGGYGAPPTYAPTYSPPPVSPPVSSPAPTGNPALPPALGSSTTSGPINLPAPDLGTTPLPRGNANPGAVVPLTPQVMQPAGPVIATPAPQRAIPSPMLPSDYAPLPQPQLTTGFATLGNCRNISAPSGYQSDRIPTYAPDPTSISQASATGYGGPVTAPAAGVPTVLPPVSVMPIAQGTPGFIATPTPMSFGGQTIVPGPAKHQPLISFGQERYPVQVGQGIFGQPVAYVPGQSIRNCIRYLCW